MTMIIHHVRLASLKTIEDLWSAWLLGAIGGGVVKGVASGDTIVHWLLLGDSSGEKTSNGVSSGDDEMDDVTNVASSSSVSGNFLRGHGNTIGITSSYQSKHYTSKP